MRIIHVWNEVGVGGCAFGKEAQNLDVASEIARHIVSSDSHGYSKAEYHKPDAFVRQSGLGYIFVGRQHGVDFEFVTADSIYRSLKVEAAFFEQFGRIHVEVRGIGIARATGSFFVAQQHHIAYALYQSAVFVHRYPQLVECTVGTVVVHKVVAYELNERSDVGVAFIGILYAVADNVQLIVDEHLAILFFV